jgi:urease accessory protein
MSTDLLVWQLLDSAFPAGGFAHSMGLEAAFQIANINSGTLASFIKQTLINVCTSILPFVKGILLQI